MTRGRWLLALVALVCAGTIAATTLSGCNDCDSPPPDSCIPPEGATMQDVCAQCGGVYHQCKDGQWVPFPCNGGGLLPRG